MTREEFAAQFTPETREILYRFKKSGARVFAQFARRKDSGLTAEQAERVRSEVMKVAETTAEMAAQDLPKLPPVLKEFPDGGGSLFDLKITLVDSKPAIWRRFCVPAGITLDRLHDVIQIVMGWDEAHLHRFEIDGTTFSEDLGDGGLDELDDLDESKYRLCQLIDTPKSRFRYSYDFGDGWEHELVLEKMTELDKGEEPYIECTDGAMACPPEDCGGIWSYPEFLKAYRNRKNPGYAEAHEWLGDDFDPEYFDPDDANMELAKYERWARRRSL